MVSSNTMMGLPKKAKRRVSNDPGGIQGSPLSIDSQMKKTTRKADYAAQHIANKQLKILFQS
jgi:hypothetical protein